MVSGISRGLRDRGRLYPMHLTVLVRLRVAALLSTLLHVGLVCAAVPLLITFQKDETEVFGDWLRYHRALASASHVHVIDHESTEIAMKRLLKRAKSTGVRIAPYKGTFRAKSHVLTQSIQVAVQQDPTIDTIIPLDADEFLVVQVDHNSTHKAYSTDPSLILDALDSLPRDGFKYKLATIPAGRCAGVNSSRVSQDEDRRLTNARYFRQPDPVGAFSKTFFPAQGFLSTDQGNHKGSVQADDRCQAEADAPESQVEHEEGACFHATPLAVVHYSGTALSFAKWKEKIFRGAAAYGFKPNSTCDWQHGFHYCVFQNRILDDEDDIRHEFETTGCTAASHSDAMVHAIQGDTSVLLEVGSASR